MPIINGWVQLTPTGNRDWSTFRTTFPGTGWVKVFRVVCACPSPDPQFLDCDVFLTGSGRLYLYRSPTEVYELGESPYTYNDIAIIGNKLYARRIGGVIDEWTIGISTISLTTPSIYNSGQGQSLTAINGQLLYDIVGGTNNGKLGYTTPGTWTEAIITPPTTLPQQGDMMQVGDDKLLVTIYDDISSMEVWDISAFPTITLDRQFQIVDNLSNVITEVQGIFQSNDTIFITDLFGNVYSMSNTSPIFFTQEGNIGTFTKWTGAAQSEECGTVIIPEEQTVPYTLKIDNTDEVNLPIEDLTFEVGSETYGPNDVDLTGVDSWEQTVNSSTLANDFNISFSTGASDNFTVTVYESVDGSPQTIIDTFSVAPSSTYNKTYTASTPESWVIILVFTPVSADEITFNYRAEHDGSTPWIQMNGLTITSDEGTMVSPTNVSLGTPPYFYQVSGTPRSPIYAVNFTLGQLTQPTNLSIYQTIDGGTETLIETISLVSSQNINKSYSPTVTTSYSLRYNFHL